MFTDENVLTYLALQLVNVKHRRLLMRDLVEGFITPRELQTAQAAYRYGMEELAPALERAREELRRVVEMGFSVTVPGMPDYPRSLLKSPNPPGVIWYSGILPSLQSVTIVGSRSASRIHMDKAYEIAQVAAAHGYDVISGGAYGIDAAAHRGAIDAGGKTFVFTASGLDIIYPQRHEDLFSKTVSTGGGVTSFVPLGTNPAKWRFIYRNKMMVLASRAVIVVAAALKSGALSTAYAAMKYGIRLIAIPGTPGTSLLLSQGAIPLEEPTQFESALTSTSISSIWLRPVPYEAILREGPKSAEEISERSGDPLAQVLSELMQAVMEGTVSRTAGLFMLTGPVVSKHQHDV